MWKRLASRLGWACLLATLFIGASVEAAAQGNREEGESRQALALKGRRMAPKGSDIDSAVTLDGLLSKQEATDWSTAKAAVIEGYVIQLEREEDGDYHMVLANQADETSTTKWVIVEVTPAWNKRKTSLSPTHLKALKGKHVRVTGWLFYETDEADSDPRGTRWELHPVTDITAL